MKKSISVMLVISIIAGLFAMCGITAAAENNILDYITYKISDNTATITGCDESISGDIVIPDTIDGYPVTAIGDDAFFNCTAITGVEIPYGVETIGFASFYSCTALEEVILPESLTYIGYQAFCYCISLKNIVIPDSVTYINGEAFCDCRALESIVLSENLSTIECAVFAGCHNLKSIIIPESVTLIDDDAFFRCYSLESITVDNDNQYYSSDEYGVLYNKDKTELIQYPTGAERSEFKIPDGVISVGAEAFQNSRIKSVVFPESLEIINANAFTSCFKLKNISFPETSNITYIGTEAFGQCPFESIELPDSVKSIGYAAFANCFNLKSITLPDGIESVEAEIFAGCFLLNEVNLPESLRNLELAFYLCPGIEAISIPAKTTAVNSALLMCGGLKNVSVLNPDIDLTDSLVGYTLLKFIGDYTEYENLVNEFSANFFNYDDSPELSDAILEYFVYLEEPEKIEDFTICGYKGSTAEAYAKEHGFNFVAICNHNYTEKITAAPTYSENGTVSIVCEYCGDVQSTYEIPMLEIESSESVTDEATDVSVFFPEGTFDGEAEIEISSVAEEDAFKLISHKQGNYKVTMFDINVTVDGQNVQPDGTVLVKIPLPKGYNQNKCVVYYVAADGTMEELKTYHYKDGYVYFETNHFSYYAILEEDAEAENDAEQNDLCKFFNKIVEFFNKIISFFKGLKFFS